jgi:rubredoxin
MPRHQNFNVIELVHAVIGQSDGLDDIVERMWPDMDWMSDMTEQEMKLFDSKVFQCQSCGWWYRQEERNEEDENEWTCKECK